MTDERAFWQWKDEMSVRSEELDYQHKHLVEILNEVHQAYTSKEHKDDIGIIIDKLSQYVVYHFTMEEVYFEMFDFYDRENHIKEHLIFRQKVDEFNRRYKSHDTALTFDVLNFLKIWLTEHIIESDQKYIDCFVKHGVK